MFHIGDQLIAINNEPIVSADNANCILKTCDDKGVNAHLLVKRMPHAVAILMKKGNRRVDNVGVETSSGTAEVSGTFKISLYSLHTAM
jgi:hypothetical protein